MLVLFSYIKTKDNFCSVVASSITVGNPRKHIFTYVAGASDDYDYGGSYTCPCARYPGKAPPSFVGEHYYCESGNTGTADLKQHYTKDPLWDCTGC